jgi:hypothetical protein
MIRLIGADSSTRGSIRQLDSMRVRSEETHPLLRGRTDLMARWSHQLELDQYPSAG